MIVAVNDNTWLTDAITQQTIDGFALWANVTPFGAVTVKADKDVAGYVEHLYSHLPPWFTIVPFLKPLPPSSGSSPPLDDPALWHQLRGVYLTLNVPRWSRIVGLDIEPLAEAWVRDGIGTMDCQKIATQCAPLLKDIPFDELYIYPGVYSYPGREADVRHRSSEVCIAIETGLRESGATRPLIRWVSQRVQGPEVLDNPSLSARFQKDHDALMSFTRNRPIAWTFFYADQPGQNKWWDSAPSSPTGLARARREVRNKQMNVQVIYPGNKNFLAATKQLVPQLPRIA